MKIIHTSDIHLDSPMTTRLNSFQATERKREIFATYRRIIDSAVISGCDAVIIAGDLFDNERVGIRTIDAAIGAIEAASEVTFFYVSGNHEKDRLLTSGLKIPKNMKIFGDEWSYFNIGDVTFAGRSSFAENMFDSLKLDESRVNIVILHGELSQHTDSISKIGIDDIAKHPIDYLALGHYHTYSKTEIGQKTTAVYCGTPEGRGFDETGEKGFVNISISNAGIQTSFVRAASRLLNAVEVDITGAEREIEIEDRIAVALSKTEGRDLVRVILTGEHSPETKRNTEALIQRFSPSFYYFEARDESRLKISSEDYKNDKSLKGEFIRLVMGKEDLTDEDKAEIIECGIRALAGEV